MKVFGTKIPNKDYVKCGGGTRSVTNPRRGGKKYYLSNSQRLLIIELK